MNFFALFKNISCCHHKYDPIALYVTQQSRQVIYMVDNSGQTDRRSVLGACPREKCARYLKCELDPIWSRAAGHVTDDGTK